MKNSRFLLSTLFAAAALSVAPAVPALADGDGSQSNPYTGSVGGLTDMFDSSKFAAGSTVYIDGITAGYFGSANTAYTCVADINIGSKGMTLTNGYSEASYTFTGKITGTGDWKFSASGVSQDYIFLGDMSGYSGNIDYTGERHDNASYPSYFYFGNGGTAATDTNISGTGSITHNETVIFNYSGYATQDSTAITIGNSSITAEYLTFTGSVNYNISSALKGTGGSSSSLTISTSGTVTLSGDVSDFASVTVSSGSTLAFDGAVSIGSAITNSGTVTLNESVIFVLDDMSFTGDWSTGATYTLVTGGTINIGSTTLTDGSTLSFDMDNLYVALGTIDSFTFNYDGTSLTVTVTGEEIVNGINGDGSAENPYFTYGTATNVNIFTGEGTTVYIATDTRSFGDANSNTYWSSGGTAACNIVIGKAGIYLTNGGSSQVHNFTGSISGEGSWTVTSGTVAQHYGFTGDLSGWSGDFTISTSNAYDYAVFGGTIDGANSTGTITGITGAKAATNESVSGKGAISVDYGVVEYVYTTGAGGTTGETLTVTNTSIEAHQIIFDGGVNYNVSSDLKGWDNTSGTSSSDSTLQISTSGTVTVSGSISNFDNIVVDSGSTLALSGSVDLSSAIENSGTVALNESVVFALDNMDYTGELSTGAVYTLITGGTIQIGNTTLTSGGTISLGVDNLYTYNSEISSATFSYDGSSLTVTVFGEAYEDGLHGDGTANSPYFTTGSGNTVNFSTDNFPSSGTLYLATDTHSLGNANENIYWSGSVTATCDIVIGAAGIYMTNGTSSNVHTFSGKISGTGSWTVTGEGTANSVDVTQHYVFTGDLSEWSGDFTITTTGDATASDNYVHFGNGVVAATNTAISGTGAITIDFGTVTYNYSGYADDGSVLTIENKSIEAHTVEFAGSVNYDVSSTLIGWDGSGAGRNGNTYTVTDSTLTISNTGTTTFSGEVSGFDHVTVASGSTLAIASTGSLTIGGTMQVDGTLDVSSAIVVADGGTVTISENAIFVLNDAAGTASGDSTIYTIFSLEGGTLEGWDSLTYTNFVLSDGTAVESEHQITINADGTVTYTADATVLDLVWNGQEGDVWTAHGNAVWYISGTTDPATFGNGDSVTFGADGATTTVIVSGTINVESITVNSDYTFTTSSGETALIDVGSLTIAESVNLTIDSGVTLYFDHDTVAGWSLGSGAIVGSGTLEFRFTENYGDTVNLGTSSDGSVFTGTVYIVEGDFQFNNSYIGEGTYRFADGVNMQQGSGSASVTVNNDIIIEGASQLHVNAGGSLTINGTLTGEGTLTRMTTGSLTVTGNVDLAGFTVAAASTNTFTGSTVNIGAYSTTTTGGSTLVLGENTQMTVGTFSASWHETVTLNEGAVLTVTNTLSLHTTNTEEFTGGTINAEKLDLYNYSSAKFSDGTLNIGSGGITNESDGSVILGDNLTVGVYAGTNGENTSWSTSSAIQLAGTGTGTTFYTREGETITLSGEVSGDGSMTKAGAGTVVLAGTSTITDLTVSGGTLEITGTTSFSGTVTLDTTLGSSTSTGTVEFASGAKLILTDSFLNADLEFASDNSSATSTVTVIDVGSITYNGVEISSDLDSFLDNVLSYDTSEYDITWDYSDGTLTGTVTIDTSNWIILGDGEENGTTDTLDGKTIYVNNSGTLSTDSYAEGATENLGAWIVWAGYASNNNGGSLGNTTIIGSGFLGLVVRYGGQTCTSDLTKVDVSNFSGQLSVVNVYGKNVTVNLSGEQWKNVEYVFGTKTAEWSGQTSPNTDSSGASLPYIEGTSTSTAENDLHHTLALQGDTTFAGITGTSKGFAVGSEEVNAVEFLTVSSSGTTLTIDGDGEYGFYGTLGANMSGSVTRASLAMTGSGTQTFGGTNYLQNVTVESGTLVLSGTTDIAVSTTVSGGKLVIGSDSTDTTNFSGSITVYADAELDLAGEVTISSGISSTGTVVIDDSATFIIDSLTVQTSDSGVSYYEIVSGGTVDGSISVGNFYVDGSALSSRWVVYTDEGGLYIYRSQTSDLIWAGTEDVHSWTTTGALDWQDNETFSKDDSVIFDGTADYKTVTIAEAIEANSVRVTGADYTFEFSNGSVTANSLTIEDSASLALTGTGSLTATTATIAGSISLGDGTTLDLSSISYSDLADIGIANVTGTGTLVVAGSDLVTLGFDLNDGFTGTLSVASGYLDVCNSITNATAFELASGTSLVAQTDNWEITQDVSFTGSSGTINLRPSGATGVVISGAVTGTSGVTIQKNGSGDITFTGSVALDGTYSAYQGTTTFAGATTIGTLNAGNQTSTSFTGESATIGTLNFNSAGYTVEFSGGGTYTVGAMNISENSTLSGTVTIESATRSGGTLFTITEGSDVTITGTFVAAQQGASGSTTALEKDAKLTVDTMTNNWGANFTLAEGSVLTVTTATFTPGGSARTVSGSGTWKATSFSFGNSANYTFEGITLDVGAMEVGVYAPGGTNREVTALTLTDVTATIGELNINVSTPLTFNGGSAEITSISISSAPTVTFTGGGTYTIGSYTLGDYQATTGSTLAIGDDTTVTIGNYEASWHQNTINLGEGATLTITTQMWFHTNSTEELTGGTINAQQLTLSNAVTILSIHDTELYIGSGTSGSNGLKNDGDGYFLFGDNLTVGVWGGTNGTNTSWATDSTIKLNGTGTGTTFYTKEGESITLAGTIADYTYNEDTETDAGNLTKTGAGTLTITGNNTFTGSVTLAEGTIKIGNSSSLGSGTITIGAGTTLASNTSSTVTLTDKSFVIDGSSTFSGIVLDGTMTFDWVAGAVISMESSASVTGTGTVTFADDTDFTYDGVILFTNTGLSADTDLSNWTAIYTGEGYESFGGTFSVDSSGNIIFVASDEYLDVYGSLVWDANNDDQTWTQGTFQSTTGLDDERNYLFNEKSTGATSLLSGEISTNRVTVTSGAGEIEWAVAEGAETASISGAELSIEAGANLIIGNNENGDTKLTVNFDEIKLGGKLTYESYGDSWSSLEFTDNGAELYIANFQNSLSIDEVIVSADAKISSHWGYWAGYEDYSALKIGTLSGTGDLSITGPTGNEQTLAVEVGDMSGYSGTITLSDDEYDQSHGWSQVVFKLVGSSSGNTYELPDITIVVGTGGTLDANGQADIGFNTVLAGGTLTSSSSISNTNIQFPTITLTADSSVEAASGVSFGMVARGFGESDLYLNGNTLTKTGEGTFFLLDTTISGAGEEEGSTGTIKIEAGTLELDGVTVNDTAIVVESGGKLSISASTMSGTTYGSTTLDNLTSSGTVEIGSGATLTLVSDTTLTGALVIDSNGTLSVTNGAVVDITAVTSQNGGTGALSISGEGSTIKIANVAWGSSSNFGSSMFNGLIQIADGGILEVTTAQSEGEGGGERAFAVTSGTGTYRYSGEEGTSYIHSTERNIHLADDATLVFEVTNSDATLNVSMEIANGMSTSEDVISSATTSTGSIEKTGAGTLILSGENLYSGGTKISAGTLEATNTSALGTGAVEIAKGASLTLSDENDGTFNLAGVSGEGSLTISAGTLATSSFTLSGDTTISTGATLALSATSDVATSSNITVNEGAYLTIDTGSYSTSFSGAITGSGTLSKSGSGTLTLTDNVSVTNIAMSAGTLSGLALSNGMTATVSGGTLDGFSMTGGELVISESTSTSITGDVTLSGGTISMTEAFDSTTPYFTVASGVTVTISGSVTFNLENLVLSGTDAAVVIFDSGVVLDGVTTDDLTLNYGGSGSGGDPHFNPDDMGFVYDEDTGSLSATLGLQSVTLYWEGSTETGGNILAAEGAQNLHDENDTYTFFLAGDTIYFDGSKTIAVSEVTLGSDINAAAIYVQNGAEITLDSDNGTYALTGEGTLTVDSSSSLTLADARHSYTGETKVDGSLTLEITEASGSGQMFASLVSGEGSLTIDIAEDLTISIADNLTGTDNQLISGEITFIKSGDGTLVVDAAQTNFSGSVEISAGTMVIASSGLFGENATIAIDTDGTLEISADIESLTETLTGAGTLLIDENLTLTTEASNIADFEGTTMLGDGVTLTLSNTSETEVTIGTAITGSNATLVKTGSGTVNLASGTTVTTINLTAGTLGNVELSEGMILTATKGTTLSGITMTGGTLDVTNVFDDPTASITLSGENSFSGGTVLLGEGTLIDETTGEPVDPAVAAFILDSGSSVSVSDDIVFSIDNVELPDAVFDDEGKRIYTISYQVFDTSSGTLSGWTDLIYSNFAIDGVVLSGSERARVEISSDGSVKFYLTDYDLTWNGGESGVWNTSDVVWTRDEGVYTEAYDNGDSVTFTNEFGKLTITLGGDVNPMTLTVAEDADVTINGGEYKITGSKTTIVIEDNGKLTLTSGGNDFGGGVTINNGGELALKVSSNEAYLDGVTIALADGASGTFTIDTDANVTYETIFTGTLTDSENLTLVKDGSGTLTITSDLGYESLDLEVKSGTLKIATDGSVGSVDINLSGSANLELENTDTENSKTISNSISGIGSATTIVKTGEGEIIIDGGDNSGFSGSVEIEAGTLTLTSTDALGNVAKTTIAEDGTLKLDIGGDLDLANISGTVSGSGTIEINLGDNGTIYASSGYYGSGKFTDFTGSFVIDSGTEITMEVDVSSTSRGSAIGDANVELGEGVNLVFNIQSAGYSYGGEISGSGTVSFNWDSTSSASHTFSLTGDNSNFSGTIEIPEDIVLTAKGTSLGNEDATVDNSGELWIDEDDTSTVAAKLTGSGSLHKTGSGAVKIENGTNDLTGSLEIREGTLCFKYTDALGNISTASVSEGAVLEVEVDDSDNVLDVVVTGEGSVVIHGEEGSCIVPYATGTDGYSTDQITLASNDDSSYNGGLTIDSAYLITSKTSSLDSMNELGTSTITITNDSTWDASNGGFTASGSRTITIEKHSRLLAGAFKAESGDYGSISISNIRIDTNAADAADLYISVTSSSDITRNYITGTGGTIYLDGVDIYLDTTITSFGQITVIDTSDGLEIVGTPSVYINGELEAESYWINGVISQDSISEDVKKHGLSYAAMVVMPTEAFIQDVRTIHTRLEQRRFAFSREGEWEFFAQAQTIQEDSGSGSDSKSFDYQTYGAIVGADVRIDQTTIFGMALAYDHGDAKLHHSEGHIKMDDYRFTAFGSKVFANWLFVEGGAQFGIGSYDIRRRAGSTVGDNNGDTDGVNVGGFFTFGGVVPITDNIFLTPYIGLTYMYSHVDSFDETGSYGYKADGFNANSLRGKIGTQLRTELMLGDVPTALALGLSYAHEFIDDDIDYDVAAITYSDKKQSLTENAFTEDLISIGLSAEFGVTDSASVFMGYNADIGLGNSEVSHAVNAGLKVTF